MSLNLEGSNGGSFCLTKPGLAIGSTTSQLSTAAASATVIDGKHQASKAATATFLATLATGAPALQAIPIGSKANFGVWLDTAGAFRVTQSVPSPVNLSTDKVGPPPNPGAGYAPVGVASVFVGGAAAGSFTFGTTAFNAAGVTTTYTDLFSPAAEAL